MFQRPARAGLVLPLALTAGLLAARATAAPVLSDPLGGPLPPSLHLAYPALYVVFAPLFSLWDGVSMLSMSRLHGFLAGLVIGYVAWRGGRALWWRLAWSDWVLPRRRAAPAPPRQRLAGLAHAPGSAVGDLARDGLDAHSRLARVDLAPVGRRPPAV